MAGIFTSICNAVAVGKYIYTPSGRGHEFKIVRYSHNEAELSVGSLPKNISISSDIFEKTVGWLKNKNYVLIRHSDREPSCENLQRFFGHNGWRNSWSSPRNPLESYVAAILVEAGIAEYHT